jgi:hypothetical protein
VRIDRTGRFLLTWECPRLTVVDSLRPDVQIRAKVTEWRELADKILSRPTGPAGTPSSRP